MNITAQIISFAALILYIISLQQNDKKNLLQIQIFSNTLYGIQYLLLNAISAACMNVVSIIGGILFYFDNKNNRKTSKYILALFIIVIGIIGVLTFGDYYSLIPIFSMMLFIYSIWQDNMTIFRIIAVISAIAYLIFNIIVGAYVAMIGSAIAMISAIIAIIRFDIKKEK